MTFIYKLVRALEENKVDYAIVGGFAVALHGAVRGTVDVDIILKFSKEGFVKAESALKALGLEPAIPVNAQQLFDFREEYIKNKNLIAWNFTNPQRPSETVDIIITHDLKKMKTETILAGGHKLRVLSVDDLIKMKKKSGRPQDLEDVKALERLKE